MCSFRDWFLEPVFVYLEKIFILIHNQEHKIMTQLDDLNAALSDLQASIHTQLEAIAVEIQQVADATGVDLSGPLAAIAGLKAGVDQSTANLLADDPTAP